MSDLLLRPGQWESSNACVAYSFLSSVALLLGFSQKHNDFLLKIYDNLFLNKIEEGSFEHQMLESLGKLPPSYVANQMLSFSSIQKKQVRIWYEELLQLDPQMKANPFFDMIFSSINPLIKNF